MMRVDIRFDNITGFDDCELTQKTHIRTEILEKDFNDAEKVIIASLDGPSVEKHFYSEIIVNELKNRLVAAKESNSSFMKICDNYKTENSSLKKELDFYKEAEILF